MANKKCSLCLTPLEGDEADILTMGAYGNPKYLCPECAELLDKAMISTDYDEITDAIRALDGKLNKANIDDRFVSETVSEIFNSAAKRATEIKEGTYDFSLDEIKDEDEMDEIPEELEETEEDRLLDEKEAAATKKFDKIMTWVYAAVLVGVVAFVVLKFIV